jgi:hypothetical protein
MKMQEHRQWQKHLSNKIRLQQAAIEVSHHRFTRDLGMEVGVAVMGVLGTPPSMLGGSHNELRT